MRPPAPPPHSLQQPLPPPTSHQAREPGTRLVLTPHRARRRPGHGRAKPPGHPNGFVSASGSPSAPSQEDPQPTGTPGHLAPPRSAPLDLQLGELGLQAGLGLRRPRGPAACDRPVSLPAPQPPSSPGDAPHALGAARQSWPGLPARPRLRSRPKKINTSDTVPGRSSLVRCPALINQQKRKLERARPAHTLCHPASGPAA